MWKGMRAGYAAIKNVTLIKPLATKLEGVVARTIAHSKGLFNPIEQLTSTYFYRKRLHGRDCH